MKNSEFEKEEGKPSLNLQLIPLVKASGGTCKAYMARLFGKKVFVKEIKPEFADDARMLAAFRKEAEIGFRLDHPHLARYVYVEGVLPHDRYIVQEFIDGLTLSDFIKENHDYFRNKQNLKRFIIELFDVIDYLHRNGIIYLDLKPENIIITRVGHTLKLVDLGFCASDFYDDTRGFTRGELAPEGIVEPRERGVESDYYGIGKILRYIRSHTPGISGSQFRTLENRLLHPDPTKRLSSKEECERILARNVRLRRLWLAGGTTLIVSALVLIVINLGGSTNSHDALIDKPVISNNSPVVKEVEPNNIEKADNSSEPGVVAVSKESNNEISYDSYERLKAEMAENINKNFAGFEKMLIAYLRDGKFTKTDYKTIVDTYNSALHKSFETTTYKDRYKDLAPSIIDDAMAEVFQEIEKANWGPAYKKYIQECQASESGSFK